MTSVPTLQAVDFRRGLQYGTTNPCVFACEDTDGQPAGEYVVKFRSTVRGGATGLLFELVAARLGLYLGLRVPSPAIVNIDENLANAIPDASVENRVRESAGLNFGCQYLSPGYVTWPINDPVPLALVTSALEIMAFDALIENVDRRREKPNLLYKGEEIFIIDHELSFSFVLLIGDKHAPFEYDSLTFLKNHPLYSGLFGHPVEISRFIGELESIDRNMIVSFFDEAPAEFGHAYKDRVTDWIVSAGTRTGILTDSLRRILS